MPAILAMPETARPAGTPGRGPIAPVGCPCPPRPRLAGVSIAELLYRVLHESVTAAALAEQDSP
jgi:hypothetical protein